MRGSRTYRRRHSNPRRRQRLVSTAVRLACWRGQVGRDGSAPGNHDDTMQTFWLAETLKYLLLLFSEDEVRASALETALEHSLKHLLLLFYRQAVVEPLR